MRIGLVTADFAPNVGGVASHVVELGRALATLGHTVHVITLPLGEAAGREAWQGMMVHRLRITKARPFYTFLLRRQLHKLVQSEKLALLHVHGLRPLEASRRQSCPVIFTNHTSGYLARIEKGPRAQKAMRARMAHVAHVLAPSQELVEASRAVGYPGPVDFLSNGVDTGRFLPGDSRLRREWGMGNDEQVALLLARRLVEKNGVTVYAEAVGALRGLPVRLVFAGDGPERAAVERRLQANGMLEKARFLGNVDNRQMPDIYGAVDISVLPSRREATSITGLESMASGLPLVGTRVGGIPYLIEEGKTGLMVPPDDPEALGAALRSLVTDAETRRAMGQAARQRAVARFDWRRIAESTLDIYRRYAR
uniref:Glycosyltransferase involved in cell wall bisynthesis n=1 Tax=Candidatus Kentrum sp. MB TaxID=2138164 RepID=A0A450WZX8_9GAMM|nr:MAG: Glycosyltransferase involved in cell wall bisynthesis [Candidatus Kentron sp. MB]VFK28915.1 MAG: Glycosyltransferase involved in cell wall bisynthesis [Candidatus Kentron sp. MB]VFK74152.1 MAG: Glycosyltransferase involved in cell wall bisynthesis [Candidatus Kentron sp. MB]